MRRGAAVAASVASVAVVSVALAAAWATHLTHSIISSARMEVEAMFVLRRPGQVISPLPVALVEGRCRWYPPGKTDALGARKAKVLHQVNQGVAQSKVRRHRVNRFYARFHCYASAMFRRLPKRCVYQRPLLVGRTECLQQQLRLRARDLVIRGVAGRSHHGSPIQGGRLRIFRL